MRSTGKGNRNGFKMENERDRIFFFVCVHVFVCGENSKFHSNWKTDRIKKKKNQSNTRVIIGNSDFELVIILKLSYSNFRWSIQRFGWANEKRWRKKRTSKLCVYVWRTSGALDAGAAFSNQNTPKCRKHTHRIHTVR